MPNHCTNNVKIKAENIAEISEFLKNGDNPFSFEKVIPQTEEVKQSIHDKSGPTPLWYSWNVDNWGTKWDSYDHIDNEYDSEEKELDYGFITAWSPPEPVISALSVRFPEAKIKHFFIEEGNCFAGEVEYENGIVVSRYEPEWDSEEGKNFREDYGFTVYSDEDKDEDLSEIEDETEEDSFETENEKE